MPDVEDLNAPDTDPTTKPPMSRRRKWLRRLGFTALTFAGLFALFLTWVYFGCLADPPELTGDFPILEMSVTKSADGRTHLGASWFEERPGRSRIYLEGDPFTIGYSNATLTSHFMRHQEEALIGTVREFFPSLIAFSGIALVVAVNNRNLPDYVPVEYQHEILGLSRGGTDPFPQYGPRYHRILNYHAAHDISHWVWDQPVVGCTAFAASDAFTADGNLIIGRNFDFEAGRHFDTNKLIGLVRPLDGHAFLSVSWPGMSGAVTGLNAEKIFCSLNGAHSEDRDNIGTPVSLIVRRVLQYAGTIDEAVEIIREGRVFVSDSYLIADGKTGRAVVVEKSPGKSAVREMTEHAIIQANHFQSDTFAKDAGNLRYMEDGTSVARHARLTELVEAQRGTLDPESAVAILRDRNAKGGAALGLGNRSAVNALIATHAVVADATRGVLWVSRGPYQLGAFDAYTIDDFGSDNLPPIAADPLDASVEYTALQERRAFLKAAKAAFGRDGQLDTTTEERLETIATQHPLDWEAALLMAHSCESAGEPQRARDYYLQTQRAEPPFRTDRDAVAEALKRLVHEQTESGEG